ncbi:hypothetical protein CS053_14865 [Rhodanobacter glycinis]|uniref:NodB homology domain-containing protein n=1 Tax=Rhodanobacter glycinis TaxID=582702 RepID=A0A5B9E596_9GAMM|nr:hypothetical protein [Rhodanobacter glycinis]QEE25641.1 hypothetical protein CS053_14865 [Rhodanobacter glycinis]
MLAKLIISLDCEGKWGVADRPVERRDFIKTQDLTDCYSRILDVFDKFDAKGTFAFVSALCLTPEEAEDALSEADLRYNSKNWLDTPLAEIRAGSSDGWSAPRLVDLVRQREGHHVCTHGGTHLPYSDVLTPKDSVLWDIGFAKSIHSRLNLGWDTIIFPRNVEGHLDGVASAGIRGYRSMDSVERIAGRLGKAARLANEFVNGDRRGLWGGRSYTESPLCALSPGKFINAEIGIRKCVKPHHTIDRVKKLLDFACANSRVVHMYTHPHNFISDPRMFLKLDAILEIASRLVSEGRLRVITMKDELNGITRV